jgi:REP element-mobilizing transposase RayT
MVELGEFVVMPDHLHGIVHLNSPYLKLRTAQASNTKTIGADRFQHNSKHSIPTIIGSFKSAVTRVAHQRGYPHEWQRGYHESIIRTTCALERISNYIRNNSKNWPSKSQY